MVNYRIVVAADHFVNIDYYFVVFWRLIVRVGRERKIRMRIWAVGLREEAQATYIALARSLAESAASDGDADGATRFYLRILERDPFDEGAHLGLVAALVAAGRHGEARRRYGFYATKMEEISVEAAPFPAVAGSTGGSASGARPRARAAPVGS